MLHSLLNLDTFKAGTYPKTRTKLHALQGQHLVSHLVFLVLIGHGEGPVDQLVLFALLWLHAEGHWAAPVLPFDDWRQLPVLVGAVGDGDHLDVPAPHLCGEVLHLLDGRDACTAACQRQCHWLVGTTIQEAPQFLEARIEKYPYDHLLTARFGDKRDEGADDDL